MFVCLLALIIVFLPVVGFEACAADGPRGDKATRGIVPEISKNQAVFPMSRIAPIPPAKSNGVNAIPSSDSTQSPAGLPGRALEPGNGAMHPTPSTISKKPDPYLVPKQATLRAYPPSPGNNGNHSGQSLVSSMSRPPILKSAAETSGPRVKARAVFCVDCPSNKVMLAENISEPLPIASITKLLTAMIVIDGMNLDAVLEVPADVAEVERHKIGIRPGDLLTVRDLLHGMLIESGNDCAEVLAVRYPRGGRSGFVSDMNRLAARIGAGRTCVYTPSGLDQKMALGRKDGRNLLGRKANLATAEDVATIARHAFGYPLIRQISSMKTYTMRTQNSTPRNYALASNDKLLGRLPVAGAKTGYTNLAGRCIVALFNDGKSERMVVILNTPKHFKAAEKIFRWARTTNSPLQK